MGLPIIIIFERHHDKAPKIIVDKLLPELDKEGYDTFCVEQPYHFTSHDMISWIDKVTSPGQQQCLMIKQHFKQAANINITGELNDLPYSSLINLLKTYIPNDLCKSSERALMIMSVSGLWRRKKIL